jgi:hypothetical protein
MNRTVEIDRYLTEIPLFSACSKRELRTGSWPAPSAAPMTSAGWSRRAIVATTR